MNRLSIITTFLFCGLGIILLVSAKEPPTKGELMKEELARKLSIFEKKERGKCTKKVLERAGELVDSTLIARAKLQVQEVIPKPEIPFRPERPEVKMPKDTTPVLPIFLEEG